MDKPTTKSEAEAMPIEDFSKLSLAEMETKLSSKSTASVEEQSKQDSKSSEEDSVEESQEEVQSLDSETEQSSEDNTADETETENVEDESATSDSENSDKQKPKEAIKGKSIADIEKQYKELQAEFTRRNQAAKAKDAYTDQLEKRLAALENAQTKSDSKLPDATKSKLAQLKEKSPETAEFIEGLIKEEMEQRLQEKLKPVEEQVTRANRQANLDAFNKASDTFKESELASLEPKIVELINEDFAGWQERILNDPTAFEQLKKEVISRNLDTVVALKSKATKRAAVSSQKQSGKEAADVGTKPNKSGGVQSKASELSDRDFAKLSLTEMEKLLPKHKAD